MSSPLDTGDGTNPDADALIDLDVYDESEETLVDTAVAGAQDALEDWTPHEGETAVAIMEQLAVMTGRAVFAINRVPELVLDQLLTLYGLTRDPGLPAAATFRFDLSNTIGNTIPAGTVLQVPLTDIDEMVEFETTQVLFIPSPDQVGYVVAVATEPGASPNGIPVGTRVSTSDSFDFLDRVTVASTITSGRESDSDIDFWQRGAQLLRRLTTTLVVPASFEAAALATPGVAKAHAVDRYNPASGNVPGVDLGHVSIAVADETGTPLSGPEKSAITGALTAQVMAGLSVHVIDATVTPVNIAATVTADLSVPDPDVLDAACVDALETWLSPLNWGWDAVVSRLDIAGVLGRVEGVRRVINVTTPSVDQSLPGVAPLTTPGSITITVQAG